MLKKINAGGVESDAGFKIQITGPETLKYTRGDFEVEFNIGYDKAHRKIYLYVSDVSSWDKWVGSKEINKIEKSELVSNIRASVRLLDGDFEVI